MFSERDEASVKQDTLLRIGSVSEKKEVEIFSEGEMADQRGAEILIANDNAIGKGPCNGRRRTLGRLRHLSSMSNLRIAKFSS